jgi:hypothetical protein
MNKMSYQCISFNPKVSLPDEIITSKNEIINLKNDINILKNENKVLHDAIDSMEFILKQNTDAYWN